MSLSPRKEISYLVHLEKFFLDFSSFLFSTCINLIFPFLALSSLGAITALVFSTLTNYFHSFSEIIFQKDGMYCTKSDLKY